ALLAELETGADRFLGVYPFGTSIHVLAAPEQAGRLDAYSPAVIAPSLEDVFVYLVKSHRKEAVA
ncbi:MAG TPA: ABC transporter ATP-binding protein, partial [Negativicutes bacterium]|nr:ABC transporter ATP-binding protein [Negativicutes bacterium]